MEALAIIPARSGSKGVPHKNIRSLGGYPLIAWSIRACVKAGLRPIVSTDSDDYATIARSYGAEIIKRPPAIATDTATDYDVIYHALQVIEPPKLIVHIRPTTPFRDPAVIIDAVESMQNPDGYTALRSVHEMPESAHKALEIIGGVLRGIGGIGMDAANAPRQSFPATYSANGYVDVLRTPFILASGRLHGDMVAPFITPHVTEVDTEADFDYLEWELSRHPEYEKRIFG